MYFSYVNEIKKMQALTVPKDLYNYTLKIIF